MTTKYTAVFTPQAWIDDYAVEVDAQGETTWDVTQHIESLIAQGGSVPAPDTYESDDLRLLDNAPKWVKDWEGPFYISVDESDDL